MKSKELKASRKNITAISNELGNDHVITHESMKDHLFGELGSLSRNAYEQGFEAFKLGLMIKGLREKQHLTQLLFGKNLLLFRFLTDGLPFLFFSFERDI